MPFNADDTQLVNKTFKTMLAAATRLTDEDIRAASKLTDEHIRASIDIAQVYNYFFFGTHRV